MRGNRKILTGIVIKTKMNKTVTVEVERRAMNKEFKKVIRSINAYKAHDEKNECKVGDRVEIVGTRPLSKEKRWRVQKILAREALQETESDITP